MKFEYYTVVSSAPYDYFFFTVWFVERIKLLLQNQDASAQIAINDRYKGATDCFKRIVREQGFLSLWRGYYITIVR